MHQNLFTVHKSSCYRNSLDSRYKVEIGLGITKVNDEIPR